MTATYMPATEPPYEEEIHMFAYLHLQERDHESTNKGEGER